ncbi:MAG TPA: LysM peptidoglycan-binding domain-containing protein [Anaerolineales bacterium]|nr:LysM peptidoglycan-binding domain-containing protein [Anaerolineales bacterium]
MLNRPPSGKTSDVINSFRKRRQQRGPYLVYGAVGLVVLGLILLIVWLTSGPNAPLGGLFATDTPTPTLTFTPTNTSTPSITPTITETATITATATPSGPFPYTIIEGDTLDGIAQRFNLGDDGILLILDQNPSIINEFGGVIFVGQTILIPPPGTTRPTSTPIPSNLARGTLIEYSVLPGDTLAGIAARFNSLEENIISENDIDNANALQVGQTLQIPVNLVTVTATLPPTSTPITPTIPGQLTATATTVSSISVTGTTITSGQCTYTESASFISELQNLINNERTSNSLTALSVNQRLVAAAKAHAIDMLCNDYFSPVGLNGSTSQTRVTAQGYQATILFENLFALSPANGGNPLAAFNWWMNDPAQRAQILNSGTTDIGIAYVFSQDSLFGGYFVLITAKP